MKKCPYCAEEIQDRAIKCKHCGEWLEKDVKDSPPQVVEIKNIEPDEVQPQEKFVSPESDEELNRKKEAGLKLCPTCGNWDAYRAIVEHGGYGDWCPHCKKSIPEIKKPILHERSKFWWLWPNLDTDKDAFDAAKMGVVACTIIDGVIGIAFSYRYYINNNISDLLGGMIIFIIYAALGYGIFKMSRIASSIALILFLIDKSYTYAYASNGQSTGIAFFLTWYLFQANRAIYWFRWNKKKRGFEYLHLTF